MCTAHTAYAFLYTNEKSFRQFNGLKLAMCKTRQILGRMAEWRGSNVELEEQEDRHPFPILARQLRQPQSLPSLHLSVFILSVLQEEALPISASGAGGGIVWPTKKWTCSSLLFLLHDVHGFGEIWQHDEYDVQKTNNTFHHIVYLAPRLIFV